MARKKKRGKKEPTLVQSLLFTLVLFALIPLPAALYFGGIEWIASGWKAVPKEFIACYVVGAIVFLLQFIWARISIAIEERKERTITAKSTQ